MDHCTECGHELGVGRYCTNCGHPVDDWRTDTAERVRPVTDVPPPAWTPPPPARFPLYADEPDASEQARPTSHRDRRRPWHLWATTAVALALVAVVGVALLIGSGDDSDGDGEAATAHETHETQEQTQEQTREATPAGEESADSPGAVGNLAVGATATVPATAAPGTDVDGNPVSFDAQNMLDGVPETAWRMPGDGTGEEIVVVLAQESKLRRVGLINGYAKQAPGRDWYHGNRRIEQVQWVFDDGTTVDQTLDDTTGVQSVDVDVTTALVRLRLVAVSEPGAGSDRRDNTAISDLSLVGGS